MSRLYAMKENLTKDDYGPMPVTQDKARELNTKEPVGIFRSVNEFDGPRRIKNLTKINAWHVDIDGDKHEYIDKIRNSPLYPSRVVESKNGFHLYFRAKNATLGSFSRIINGLIKHFGGDTRAKMVTVLLREPGYLHKKDIHAPYLVKEVFSHSCIYSESDMFYFFPFEENKAIEKVVNSESLKHINLDKGGLSYFLNNLDHEQALLKISGSPYVGGETYSFKEVSGGNKNILVNGKSTSCFVDANKKIGAVPGGPTIFQWLRYFNHDDKKIYRILKEYFGGDLKGSGK